MDVESANLEVISLLEGCTIGGFHLVVEEVERLEIKILLNGGVKVHHFKWAINLWVNSKSPINNNFGFIKWAALRKAAESLFEVEHA